MKDYYSIYYILLLLFVFIILDLHVVGFRPIYELGRF